MDNITQKNIQQLQLMEQNMQALLSQRQKFQAQVIEIESALKELDKTDTAYRIIGNIMVHSDKGALKKELESKKEIMDLRIKAIEKQELSAKEKASELQKTILGGLSENN